MGACAGKGAAPKDPDKQPQAASTGDKKARKKKGHLSESEQTPNEGNGAKVEQETNKEDGDSETGNSQQDKQGETDEDVKDTEELIPTEEKPTLLVAPTVGHLPPTKSDHPCKDETSEPTKSHPEAAAQTSEIPPSVGQPTRDDPVKHEEVFVKLPAETPRESPIIKTSPTAWKPTPLSGTKSSFSSFSSPSQPPPARTFPTHTSPLVSPTLQGDSTVKVESKKEEKVESDMTVTVQSRTITKETRDTSLDQIMLPSLGEPISAEAIIQSVREKTKDQGISISSQSKTTTVVKKMDSTGKEVVDVKTTETTYDGPSENSGNGDVFVKTTSTRFTGDPNEASPETTIRTTTVSSAKREQSADATPPKVRDSPNTKKETQKNVNNLQMSSNISAKLNDSTETKELNTSPTTSPSKAIKLEKLIIRETTEVPPKDSESTKSPTSSGTISPGKSPAIKGPEKKFSPAKTPNIKSPTSASASPEKEAETTQPSSPKAGSPGKTSEPTRLPSLGNVSPGKTSGLRSPTKPANLSTSKTTSVSTEKSAASPVSPSPSSPIKMAPVGSPSPPSPAATITNGSMTEKEIPTKKSPPPMTTDDKVAVDDTVDADLAKRNLVKSILCDSMAGQDVIAGRHEWCPNTRTRLVQCIDKWANGEDTEKDNFRRVWAIIGKSGMGKSAIAAEVLRKHSTHVAGAHFFHHRSANLDNNDARYVVRSFASQMCESLPKYYELLPTEDILQEAVDSSDLSNLFNVLIREPLLSPQLDHDPDQPALVILDAIDECNAQTRTQLLQLINTFGENTPDWLYLLVTTRDENQILSQLENVRTLELKNANDNLSDIKRYLKEPMAIHMDRISLDGGLTQLVKKTDGNFLCAKYLADILRSMSADKKIALREIEGLFQKGLNNTYKDIFKAFKQNLSNQTSTAEVSDLYQKVVGILCCALEPLSSDFLRVLKLNEDTLSSLMPVMDRANDRVSFSHRNIIEWLHSQQDAGEYHVAVASSRQQMSEYCWKWLEHIRLTNSQTSASIELQNYALKRAIWHFLDIQKQQENVAGLLCELKYIEEKFKVPGVAVRHVLSDYRHAHQYSTDAQKVVTMSDYMKKHPKLLEQMMPYYNFVKSEGSKLQQNPEFAIHVAANYPNCVRIQQNARVELEGKHWIEELTSRPETHNISKGFAGEIQAVDLSPDGKTLAVISKDEQQNVALCFINITTCEKRMEPVDIKMLKDRIGLCAKYLSDGSAVFVGSLTTFINTKQGKPVPSGIDASSVQMKEKYAIECCNISRKYLACGLSTFPWGGRSLHLCVFDLKTKKSIKTFEVLKFRFGGSAQFGVKCCALSEDDSMIGACVKQSNKEQLVCTVWCLTKWNVLYTISVDGDTFSRCLFVSNSALLIGTSVNSVSDTVDSQEPMQSKLWQFKDGNAVHNWDENELFSVFNGCKNGYISGRWYIPNGKVLLQQWGKKVVKTVPQASFIIHGLDYATDIFSSGDHIMVIMKDELKSYNVSDLQVFNPEESTGVMDVLVRGITFHPRSDEAILSHSLPKQNELAVGLLTPKPDDLSLSSTPFTTIQADLEAIPTRELYFHGTARQNDLCQTNSDGNFTLFNVADHIQVWNRTTNTTNNLPKFQELNLAKTQEDVSEMTTCVVSQKDNIVGVMFAECPNAIVTFDLKSRQMSKTFKLQDVTSSVSDFIFVPSNGHLMAFYAQPSQTLVVWNQRTASVVSKRDQLNMAYARMSPASDRLVLSLYEDKHSGKLLLRNSDGNFGVDLDLPGRWNPAKTASDLEFSADGTIVAGVCMETGTCRVWNAGNGELLKDLPVQFTSFAEVVGMLTNTHVIFRDGSLRVVDIASGEVVAVLPIQDSVMSKTSPLGMRVSPKGNYILVANEGGQLKVFQCHNFSAVKRKTTLQRMKSFTK